MVVAASVGYVFLIATARLYLGVHSLADLFGGLQMGFLSVLVCDAVLLPLVVSFASDPEASMAITLVVAADATIDGSTVAALALCAVVLLVYPDRRDNWTTYKDTVTMVGLTSGWLLVAGPRLSGKLDTFEPVQFGGNAVFDGPGGGGAPASPLSLAVSLGSCLALFGGVEVLAGKLASSLEASFGFRAGVFKLGKYVSMGVFLAWAACGGVCHLDAHEALTCAAAWRSLVRRS
jgi:hypothetical protein